MIKELNEAYKIVKEWVPYDAMLEHYYTAMTARLNGSISQEDFVQVTRDQCILQEPTGLSVMGITEAIDAYREMQKIFRKMLGQK